MYQLICKKRSIECSTGPGPGWSSRAQVRSAVVTLRFFSRSNSAAVKALRVFAADIVVSDVAMPGEDGYVLMRQLREIEPELGRHIPAMSLTGYGRPQDRTRILASGFQKYIQKPVEPIVLARAIAELLRG